MRIYKLETLYRLSDSQINRIKQVIVGGTKLQDEGYNYSESAYRPNPEAVAYFDSVISLNGKELTLEETLKFVNYFVEKIKPINEILVNKSHDDNPTQAEYDTSKKTIQDMENYLKPYSGRRIDSAYKTLAPVKEGLKRYLQLVKRKKRENANI